MAHLHPQDVLLSVRLLDHDPGWTFQSLGTEIGISASQCHSAFRRLAEVSIVDPRLRVAIRGNLLEFLEHAVKYCFPAKPAGQAVGIPTAHSAPVLHGRLFAPAGQVFVWESHEGAVEGSAIEPLYKTVPWIALRDSRLYAIMAVVDSLRVGKTRERSEASALLKDLVYGKP